MKIFFFCLIAILFLTPVASKADSCARRLDFRLSSEGPWPQIGGVRSGGTCTGNFSARGNVTFKHLLLASAPQHGSINLINGGLFNYKSTAGYSGPDQFVLRVCGVLSNVDKYLCANVQYNMTISN